MSDFPGGPPKLDAAVLAEILGLEPDIFQLRWARTVQLGTAGSVTLALDLDVRKLTEDDKGLVRALIQTMKELIVLSEQAKDVGRRVQ